MVLSLGTISPGTPTGFDVRCARLGLAWDAADGPLCCARGAHVDGRHRDALRASLGDDVFSGELPGLRDGSPSGVVVRLADRRSACAALGDLSGGVLGDGCRLRGAARAEGLDEDAWLLDDCALFPLDLVGGDLVPSSRIPAHALVPSEGEGSLWSLARPRVARRFGDALADAVDAALAELAAKHGRGVHLKTVR